MPRHKRSHGWSKTRKSHKQKSPQQLPSTAMIGTQLLQTTMMTPAQPITIQPNSTDRVIPYTTNAVSKTSSSSCCTHGFDVCGKQILVTIMPVQERALGEMMQRFRDQYARSWSLADYKAEFSKYAIIGFEIIAHLVLKSTHTLCINQTITQQRDVIDFCTPNTPEEIEKHYAVRTWGVAPNVLKTFLPRAFHHATVHTVTQPRFTTSDFVVSNISLWKQSAITPNLEFAPIDELNDTWDFVIVNIDDDNDMRVVDEILAKLATARVLYINQPLNHDIPNRVPCDQGRFHLHTGSTVDEFLLSEHNK